MAVLGHGTSEGRKMDGHADEELVHAVASTLVYMNEHARGYSEQVQALRGILGVFKGCDVEPLQWLAAHEREVSDAIHAMLAEEGIT
jgi:hypothetical protein